MRPSQKSFKKILSYYVPLEAFDATAAQYDFSENVGVASVMVIVSVAVAVSVAVWLDAALKYNYNLSIIIRYIGS